MSNLVEVKPIETKRWHGKSGKETFARPLVLEALCDVTTHKYATGLSEQERLELQNSTGYDLSDDYNVETPHPFWNSKTAQVELPYRTTIFNMANPLHRIKVGILKASKFVANSQKELDEGLFPHAQFVIFDEKTESDVKAGRIQKKRKANTIAMNLSNEEKANIIQILSKKSLRNQSQNYLDVEIDSLIENDIDEFLRVAEMDKKDVYNRATVLEAIHKNVLQKEGSAVLYMGDRIGFNLDEAVKYFSDPENQQLKALVLEKLN